MTLSGLCQTSCSLTSTTIHPAARNLAMRSASRAASSNALWNRLLWTSTSDPPLAVDEVDATYPVVLAAHVNLTHEPAKARAACDVLEAGLAVRRARHVVEPASVEKRSHQPDARSSLSRQLSKHETQLPDGRQLGGNRVVHGAFDLQRPAQDGGEVEHRARGRRGRNSIENEDVLGEEETRLMQHAVVRVIATADAIARHVEWAGGEARQAPARCGTLVRDGRADRVEVEDREQGRAGRGSAGFGERAWGLGAASLRFCR
jgi:hypothetical protein